jgi:hypothetical protein
MKGGKKVRQKKYATNKLKKKKVDPKARLLTLVPANVRFVGILV